MLEDMDFEFSDIVDRNQLLHEAISIISCSDGFLGEANRGTCCEADEAVSLLNSLREETVAFPSVCSVVPMTEQSFISIGLQPSDMLRELMVKFNFFRLDIPMQLIPRCGWAFTRLKCRIKFCPGEDDVRNLVIIHDLSPKSEWQTQLKISSSLDITLDASLKYNMSITAEKASAVACATGGLGMVFGPFHYGFRRAKIRTGNTGHQLADWYMEGTERIDEEMVNFGVILRVPKERQLPIHACGAFEARHSFQLFTSDIFTELWDHFSENVKSLFTNGCPITTTKEWDDITQLSMCRGNA